MKLRCGTQFSEGRLARFDAIVLCAPRNTIDINREDNPLLAKRYFRTVTFHMRTSLLFLVKKKLPISPILCKDIFQVKE